MEQKPQITIQHIRITQVSPHDGPWHIEVATYLPDSKLDGKVYHVHDFHFPSSDDDEARLSWYLQTHTTVDPYPRSRAAETREWLLTYQQSLIDQLHLSDVFSSASRRRTNIIIDIHGGDGFQALHWEILESDHISSIYPGFSVAVRRRVPGSTAKSNPVSNTSAPLRILCVVSRKPGQYGYDDVDSRNVTLPLVNMLSGASPTLVHFDIVRPGTWLAFTNALKSKEAGYYHIVHFDVHGEIRSSSEPPGRKPVILFRKKTITRDYQIGMHNDFKDAAEVAEVLADNKIRLVVLNACQSARVTGVGGSFAQILIGHGVPSVIGMSFNVHETAASKFINSFYRSLLFDKLNLLEATFRARSHLRKENKRKSLFNLRVVTDDWIVPVLYEAESVDQHLDFRTGLDGTVTDTDDLDLIGRSGEIYFLEESLLTKSKVIVLSGCRGVGKRALLNHLADWWIQSKFVEAVYQCDFKQMSTSHPTFSMGRLVTAIDNLITSVGSPAHGVFNIDVEPCALTEFWDAYPDIASTRVIQHFSSGRYLLLLHNVNWVKVYLPDPDVWYNQLSGFLRALDSEDSHSFAILSSTSTEPLQSWHPDVGAAVFQKSPQEYTLEGLEHFSAIRFVSQILEKTPRVKYIEDGSEHIYLEHIVDLYEGHPLACKLLFERFRDSSLSPKAFFQQLLIAPPGINWHSPDLTEYVISYIVALQALLDIPQFEFLGLFQVPLYIPRSYFVWLLKKSEDDPTASKECEEVMETLEDMEVGHQVQLVGLDERGFELTPMFSLFLKDQEPLPIQDTNSHDLALYILANFYAGRCDSWTASDQVNQVDVLLRDPQKNVGREWGNVLRVLEYIVQQPFNWDADAEQWFDPVFRFAVLASISIDSPKRDGLLGRKGLGSILRHRGFISDIAQRALERIIRAFVPKMDVDSPWWMQLNLGSVSPDSSGDAPLPQMKKAQTSPSSPKPTSQLLAGPEVPDWLFDRILEISEYQTMVAYRSYSKEAWSYNKAIRDLGRRRRELGKAFSITQLCRECNAAVMAADIAVQCQSHILEGLAAVEGLDLSVFKNDGRMKKYVEYIQTRIHLVRGELVGMDFDIDQVWDQTSKKEGHFIGGPDLDREAYGPDHILSDRWFYEHARAGTRKDLASIPLAIAHLTNSLKWAISKNDKGYELVLRQFLYKLYEIDKEWEAAIMHLHAVGKIVFRNGDQFKALLHADGPDSFREEWKKKNGEWCANLGDQTRAQKYRDQAEDLLREFAEQDQSEIRDEGKDGDLLNLLSALEFAVATSGVEPPRGFKKPEVHRVSSSSAAPKE